MISWRRLVVLRSRKIRHAAAMLLGISVAPSLSVAPLIVPARSCLHTAVLARHVVAVGVGEDHVDFVAERSGGGQFRCDFLGLVEHRLAADALSHRERIVEHDHAVDRGAAGQQAHALLQDRVRQRQGQQHQHEDADQQQDELFDLQAALRFFVTGPQPVHRRPDVLFKALTVEQMDHHRDRSGERSAHQRGIGKKTG